MSKDLEVGIIGASAERGWARESHVPAVQALSGLKLGAIATKSQDTADAAAKVFGARVGYADPQALFADAAIDIVTIAVKVPDHHDLVLGALSAGKHVYCEWPLSPTLAQAEELAAAAREAQVKVAVGLQSRMSPAAERARNLIARGAVGRVLGARCFSTAAAWGAEIEPGMTFAEKPDAGMNLVIIQGMHTLDLMLSLVGGLADASALAVRQYTSVSVKGEARKVERETFDHVLVHGDLEADGTLAAEVMGGRSNGPTPFELVVTGDRGELSLAGGAARGFQSGRLALSLDGEQQDIDEGKLAGLPDAAVNVACVYAALRDDILHDTHEAADFDHAVRLTRLYDDLLSSSAEARKVMARDWPDGRASRHG